MRATLTLVLMAKKKALGRGLGALISSPSGSVPVTVAHQPMSNGSEPFGSNYQARDAYEDDDGLERVEYLSTDQIQASPLQPRKRFNDEALTELMESIREHGVIQPLIVRMVGDHYELIAGERRFRACQGLGYEEVPAIVRDATDGDVLEMALIENLQREDLDPIEEAEAYMRLAKEFHLRQEDIAKKVGKNRATVANTMRLLDLHPDVRAMVSQGILSSGHAKALLALKNDEEQCAVSDRVVRQKLTVRDTEKLVNRQLAGLESTPIAGGSSSSGSSSSKDPKPSYLLQIEDQLRSRYSTSISIVYGKKKGKIEIEFFGDDELERVLELMGVDLES